MKKILGLFVIALLALSIMPAVLAVSVGSGITPDITTEKFEPIVFLCDNRIVIDDSTEPGRVSAGGQELVERTNNYAFEGESIHWTVLAMDKNGIEKLQDVYATVGDTQGAGNDIEVECKKTTGPSTIPASCNARILEEELTAFDSETMQYYECTLTVETAQSMYGKYWLTVEAVDEYDQAATIAENENWFLNPVIALSINGDLTFEDVRPGTDSYSSTILVGNDADQTSGVLLDMFISGTDFYDSSSSGALCPTTNKLALENFRYYATNGAYSTVGTAGADAEGYRPIEYGIGFNNPNPFYDSAEILPNTPKVSGYYTANILNPGSEMAITFKLSMPEPCNGDFNEGTISFWGEAI